MKTDVFVKPICGNRESSSGVTTHSEASSCAGSVLLLASPECRVSVSRVAGPADKVQYHEAVSFLDACRLLLTYRCDVVIVMPGALKDDNETALAMLRIAADGAAVLVLSDGGQAPTGCADQTVMTTPVPQGRIPGGRQTSVHNPSNVVSVGPIIGYRGSGMIAVDGKLLKLSVTHARILWRLLDAPQNRCTSRELIDTMCNPDFGNAPRTLRVHIHRLRAKLAAHGAGGMLVNGSGGYWLHWPAGGGSHPWKRTAS